MGSAVGLLQEMKFAVGFKQQADLVTPLVAADCWSLRSTNTDLPQIIPQNEDDAADLGKGVYATKVFKSHIEAQFPRNGRLSSEWGAMLAAFGLGNAAKTAAGSGFKYTSIAPIFETDGLDLPSTTAVGTIRQGGSALHDLALIGCVLEEFGIEFRSGPGRDNATFTSTWVGSGRFARPSTITMPAVYGEHSLNAGGLTSLTLVGVDYLTSARFAAVNFGLTNNLRTQLMHHPGSGLQGGYQVAGRMWRGVPAFTLTAQVFVAAGSAEQSNIENQTAGTGVINVEGDTIGAGPSKHGFKITFHRLITRVAPIGEVDGIAAYNIEYSVQEHATNGVLTIEATCEQDNILVAAA